MTFNLEWSPGTAPQVLTPYDDSENRYQGRFIQGVCQATWSGENPTSTFVSDPAETSNAVFAAVGVERNGVFFRES